MKKYGKLEDGQLIYAPVNLKVDGGVILNANIDEDIMRYYGFKEVIRNIPEEVGENYHLDINGYTEEEERIIINYNIVENKPFISLEDQIMSIENINKAQDDLINTTMMATDEMFSLIEPLLGEELKLKSGGSKMVDMYVAMVIRGLKELEDVPIRYREQVKEILEMLEY